MRFRIYRPAYINGEHLGADASLANPIDIDLPKDAPVSVEWSPLDSEAKEAHDYAIEQKVEALSAGRDPKDAAKVDMEIKLFRKRFTKQIAPPAEPPKEVPREVDTNAEMASGKRKVVGRPSDKSPV